MAESDGFLKDNAFEIFMDTKTTSIFYERAVTCMMGVGIYQDSNSEGEGGIQIVWYKTITRNYDEIREKGFPEPELAKQLIQELRTHQIIP